MTQRQQQRTKKVRTVTLVRRARQTAPEKSPRQRSAKRRSTSESIGLPRQSKKGTGISGRSRIDVHIRVFGIDVDQDTRNHLRRKVDRRFGKFATSIERVSIRFRDVNGPRGGVDQVCRLKVVLKKLPSIVFENQDTSLDGAFSGALSGAERKVRRNLQRRRSKPMKESRSAILRLNLKES
jgi:hypothetical protein